MSKKRITVRVEYHRGSKVCLFLFAYDAAISAVFRELGARYSRSYGAWYVEYGELSGDTLRSHLPQCVFRFEQPSLARGSEASSDSTAEVSDALRLFGQKLSALNYSANTIKNYSSLMKRMLDTLGRATFDQAEVYAYMSEHLRSKGYSSATMRQFSSALRLYSEHLSTVTERLPTVATPRRERILPKVVSEEAVRKLILATDNMKHKAIMSTLYSTGLRVGELLQLRVTDVQGKRGLIRVNRGKGRKDRQVPLSSSLRKILREYYAHYRPKEFLFEGAQGGSYTASSINQILRKNSAKAGLAQRVTAHMLRHSFATHMLEKGVSLRHIQEILGHKSSRTTEIYTHVTSDAMRNLVNPLDSLFYEQDDDDLPF